MMNVTEYDMAPESVDTVPDAIAVGMRKCMNLILYEFHKGYSVIARTSINVETILENDPRLLGILACGDQIGTHFTAGIWFTAPPPWYSHGISGPRRWRATDAVELHLWLQREWNLDFPIDQCQSIAVAVACRNPKPFPMPVRRTVTGDECIDSSEIPF